MFAFLFMSLDLKESMKSVFSYMIIDLYPEYIPFIEVSRETVEISLTRLYIPNPEMVFLQAYIYYIKIVFFSPLSAKSFSPMFYITI